MSYTLEELRALCKREPKSTLKSTPRIFIFDIETSPMVAYVWKRFKETVSLDQTIQESFMICWSGKWLYEEEILSDTVTPEEAKKADDSRVVKSLYENITKADIIIAYNGKNFDIPYMNERFLVHGLKPYTPVFVVDPYETVKHNFRFSSNKMDNVATQLGLSNKIGTDFSLWKGCMGGRKESLEEMVTYNKQDVKVLEEIYLNILPWIKNHPNISSFSTNKNICPSCGDHNIVKIPGKYYYTPSGAKYELFRCQKCNTIFRGRISVSPIRNSVVGCLR